MRKKPQPRPGTVVRGVVTINVFADHEHGDIYVLGPDVGEAFNTWEQAIGYAGRHAAHIYREPRTAGMGLEVQIVLHGDEIR